MIKAGRHGQNEVIAWVQTNVQFYDFEYRPAICEAVRYGNLKTLRYIRERLRIPLAAEEGKFLMRAAAYRRQFRIMLWLHKHGCPLPEKYMPKKNPAKTSHACQVD